MKKQEPSNHVRLAATNALLNSLEFTRSNFSNDVNFDDIGYLLQILLERTTSNHAGRMRSNTIN
jgi:importin subunit beta-1